MTTIDVLKIDENYDKATLPDSENRDPCIVFINVTIFALPILSTKELRFTADFYLNLRWYDLRLTLLDLNLKNRMSESLYAGRDVVSSRIPWMEFNKLNAHNIEK